MLCQLDDKDCLIRDLRLEKLLQLLAKHPFCQCIS